MSALDQRVRDILRAFAPEPGERPWYGGASLLGGLRGVGVAEATWRAPGHDSTVWQLALHCAHGHFTVRRSLCGLAGEARPVAGGYFASLPAEPTETLWRAARSLVREQRDRLAEAVRAMDPARLDEQATQQWSYADLLWGVVMHDAYHAGHISAIRRAYAARG